MPQPQLDRRLLLGGLAVAGPAVASAATAQTATAPAVTFTPKPLPFDPKAVAGLSEKLLVSHHDNNYAGAVKRLGSIRGDLGKLDWATAPVYQVNGLKREELIAWNSMILHEVYFAGLGAQAAASASLAKAIERDFGSHDRWAAEFAGMGKALGGGSGWVILTASRHDSRLVNTWAADHTMTLADGAPLLVLDMYEHAYHMDYGAKAGAYVDAFMKAVSWGHANDAFARTGVA
ncbi:superoxide dismutase [Phenylobacterium aquaticum]|uniref:superoxide dismutase n=1 Tax=Phenylobacterium aquaticum TaxID=1763816 RepID=UPI001F5E1C4C|nr:Fe-Mn family superoxide dismutase [Phenylobacterium aquaticum]MCI3132840.1 Fe-Mn family superoxide dismutase [Phenylobacterium aquaticum]